MNNKNRPVKKYPIIGACGLECGLCTRYYTVGLSRCPGCCGGKFFNKHPTCSTITCCVKKKNLEVCAECKEFPCSRFKGEEEYLNSEPANFSYPPYRKIIPNLNFIRKYGLEKFIMQYSPRIILLETLIENFNGGRSRGLFCWAAALIDIKDLEMLLNKSKQEIKEAKIDSGNTKSKAGIMKKNIYELFKRKKIKLNTKKPDH